MTRNFSVLFAVDTTSKDDCSAVQRFRVLKVGLEKLGVQAGIIYLGDYPVGSPRILLAANTPLFLKTVRNYDFIHCAGLSVIAMACAKSLSGYRIVYDVHGSSQEYKLTKKSGFEFSGNYQMLAALLAWRTALQRADYFVTVSEPLQKEILRNGIAEEKTDLIYNGVDTQLFKPSKEKSEGTFTVTYAGAYQKWQGIENLVQAAEILREQDVRFRFMGFQKHDIALKQAIRERLPHAELIDFQPRVENKQPTTFIQGMAESDVLIIPRYTDPNNPVYSNPDYVRNTFGWLPTKFAEYLATGRPVIVTTLDVAAEFTEKYDCGFVCDADPQSLSQAILKAKGTPVERLDEMGKNGRHLAEERFDIQVLAKKYFRILSGMLAD